MGRVGIASVLLLALISGARAEITLDEARAAAERYAGRPLVGAQVREVLEAEYTKFLVDATDDGGMVVSYCVDGETGALKYWVRSRDPSSSGGDGVALSRDSAIAQAKEEATRVAGAAAESATWRAHARGRGWEVTGEGPLVGDPPRHGLSPEFVAAFGDDGMMTSYRQHLPGPGERPLPVRVTGDQAIAAAQGAVTPHGLPASSPPYLFQGWQGVTWIVSLGPASSPEWQAVVSAETGDVLSVNPTGAVAPASRRVAANSRLGPWLPLGAGAVALLLLLAGTVVVVRRRRRAA